MNKDYEMLKEVVANSHNISEVCRQLGLVPRGGNHIRIKQKIQEYHLDTTHFTTGIWNKGLRYSGVQKTRSLEEILQKGVYYSSNKLKNRLLKSGLKNARCENCGLDSWLDQPIKLELHHINGDHSDNRLENIQLLCPNCHAYTDTYRGKNINPDEGWEWQEDLDDAIETMQKDGEIDREYLYKGLKKLIENADTRNEYVHFAWF